MDSIKIIKSPDEKNPFVVVFKSKGIPSAPISESDKENAFSKAAELFPQLLSVHGKKEIEHGLLHRLDTVTSGLILIAATQDFYDFMIEQQQNDKFIKYYKAECCKNNENSKLLEGFPVFTGNIGKSNPSQITSYFRGFGKGQKEVRPVTENSSKAALQKMGKQKLYTTEVLSVENCGTNFQIICKLTQGYRHQIRCHLAWSGFPIENDKLYNCKTLNTKKEINFEAFKIEFFNPILKEKMIFEV